MAVARAGRRNVRGGGHVLSSRCGGRDRRQPQLVAARGHQLFLTSGPAGGKPPAVYRDPPLDVRLRHWPVLFEAFPGRLLQGAGVVHRAMAHVVAAMSRSKNANPEVRARTHSALGPSSTTGRLEGLRRQGSEHRRSSRRVALLPTVLVAVTSCAGGGSPAATGSRTRIRPAHGHLVGPVEGADRCRRPMAVGLRAGRGEPDRAPGDGRHQHRRMAGSAMGGPGSPAAPACAPTTEPEPAPAIPHPTSDGTQTTPSATPTLCSRRPTPPAPLGASGAPSAGCS